MSYRPPSFDEADLSDKPWTHPRMKAAEFRDVDRSRLDMLGSLQAVDRAVGALFETLQRRGVLDRTVVVFMSDNGFLWGEHRLRTKIWPYEESIRIPLIIRAPRIARAGISDAHLAANIDIAPTLADYAGVRPGRPQDGRSLVPLMTGSPRSWRTAIGIEYLGNSRTSEGPSQNYAALRTDRYVYIRYANGRRELYDLRTDPYELRNLTGTPWTRTLQASLGARLRRLIAR